MSQYFSRKALFSLFVLNLFAQSINAQQQVFKCSPQTLDALCSEQNLKTVCAVDDDNEYLTFKSACEACSYEDTVSYTEGHCTCPEVACNQNQNCIDGRCVNIQSLATKQLVEMARDLLGKQKHSEALIYIQRIMNQRPKDSYPLYLAALASFGDQKHQESLKYIKKAITLDPNLSDYYIIRGRAFSALKKFDEAEKQFQKALSMGFDDVGLVSFYQAQNLLTNKKNEEAIKKFEQALKYHPEKTSWYVRKALAHAINKEDKMSIITCKQGLKIDPKNEQILSFMKQFKIMDSDKQKDLEQMQQRNLQAQTNTKKPDPQMISNFMKQKEEQQKMEFDRARLEQKKKKEQEQKKEVAESQF